MTITVRHFLASVACHALTGFCVIFSSDSAAAVSGCARETQEWRIERVAVFEARLKLLTRDSAPSIALIRDIYFGRELPLR